MAGSANNGPASFSNERTLERSQVRRGNRPVRPRLIRHSGLELLPMSEQFDLETGELPLPNGAKAAMIANVARAADQRQRLGECGCGCEAKQAARFQE